MQELRCRASDLSGNLEDANVTFDQLKECLSPHDVKALSQRLWLLTQRQADLEHQLLMHVHLLEDRLEVQQVFNTRHARFMTWAQDLTSRFEKGLSGDSSGRLFNAEARAKRLEAEVAAEVTLKTREHNWLQSTGRNIIEATREPQQEPSNVPTDRNRADIEMLKVEIEYKILQLEETWEKLKHITALRTEKKAQISSTMEGLWKRIEEVKTWLTTTEKKLETPVIFEKSSKKFVDKLAKEHELIQKNIEQQSGNIGELLNLCEILLGDPGVQIAGVDTNEFEREVQALERRYP